MFKCAFDGHDTEPGEDKIQVITKIRTVDNVHKITPVGGKEYSTVGSGFEIVEEKAYCWKHIPNELPEVVGSVLRKHEFIA